MDFILEKGERIEDLQCDGLKIVQNKNLYTFTSDSVVLANFIQSKKKDVCVEIGAGSGVISILLSAKTNFEKIFAFELQTSMSKLLEKNIHARSRTYGRSFESYQRVKERRSHHDNSHARNGFC